jgi:hypothetical protein
LRSRHAGPAGPGEQNQHTTTTTTTAATTTTTTATTTTATTAGTTTTTTTTATTYPGSKNCQGQAHGPWSAASLYLANKTRY